MHSLALILILGEEECNAFSHQRQVFFFCIPHLSLATGECRWADSSVFATESAYELVFFSWAHVRCMQSKCIMMFAMYVPTPSVCVWRRHWHRLRKNCPPDNQIRWQASHHACNTKKKKITKQKSIDIDIFSRRSNWIFSSFAMHKLRIVFDDITVFFIQMKILFSASLSHPWRSVSRFIRFTMCNREEYPSKNKKKNENVIQYIALHCVHAIRFALRECVFNSMLNNWDEKYRNNDGNSGVSKFDEQTKNWKLSDLIEQIERRIMLIWCWNIFTIRQHTLAWLHWISECYSTGRHRRRTAKKKIPYSLHSTALHSIRMHEYFIGWMAIIRMQFYVCKIYLWAENWGSVGESLPLCGHGHLVDVVEVLPFTWPSAMTECKFIHKADDNDNT